MGKRMTRYARVALSVAGSAILLFSCSGEREDASSSAEEAMMTEYSEHLSIINSQNGRRSYHFVTPLLEGYTLTREPYREFRKGIKITTYQDDSLSSVDAVLTANYAIYYEKRELWEAKGNVVVEKSDGKTLYTQQLFWNARTGKIYSNVDSKIVQNNGRDVFIGEGFESDEEFKDWRFRRMKGRMEVEMKQAADSTADSTAVHPDGGFHTASAAPAVSGPAQSVSRTQGLQTEFRAAGTVQEGAESRAVAMPQSGEETSAAEPSALPRSRRLSASRRGAVPDVARRRDTAFADDTLSVRPAPRSSNPAGPENPDNPDNSGTPETEGGERVSETKK